MSYNNSQEGDALPCVSVNIVSRHNKIEIGAAVYSKSVQKLSNNFQNDNLYQLDLYDFCDNEQLSNLDCLLNQLGAVVLYLPEEYEQKKDMLSRKLNNILDGKELELVYLKRTSFGVSSDISTSLVKLVGKPMHGTNIAESERPIAFGCAGCLIKCLRLLDDESLLGHVEVVLKSLNTFMRLDTSAMEAINLFPKPDHPSQFGSLYGILNKCKTKMGSRLLER